MKPKSKVPLYQINLEIKSTGGNEFKNNESSILDQASKSSSHGRYYEEESKQQQSQPESDAGQSKVVKNEGRVPLVAIEIQSSEKQPNLKENPKDQDTDPKHEAYRSDDNGSNFSLDSIPSENDKNDDQKDVKLRGHTTGRMPVRNIVKTRGSGMSQFKWTQQSQVTNSSNYMYTMECYNDSDDMELVNPIVDHVSQTNQVMFTEGFPSTDFHGTRANSLIEMKAKRDSFQQQTIGNQQQHTYLKGSHIRNPREYLVKKSQINLISQQDNQVVQNNRSQKYPTMFKYLCNLNKNQNQQQNIGDKKPKHMKAKNSGSTIQPSNKNGSPPRGTTIGSYQKSNRRKAGQMISQITLGDDETQKVVTDDEQDHGAVGHPFTKAKTHQSKQSDRILNNSMGLHGQDTSQRVSDTKQGLEPISVRISKLQSSETFVKEKTIGTDQQRTSTLKEEDALNDTIDEIGTLNKSDKPKTHRSKYSSEFQKNSIKMQPSQIIKKSNIVNKTPVMILKIDLQKKPQAVPAIPKGADPSLSSSQSPLRKQAKKDLSYKTKHESLRISTEVMAQTEKKQAKNISKDHDQPSHIINKHKYNRQNSAGKRLQQTGKVEAARSSKQVDETYQLDFDKNMKSGTAQGLKKIGSKENLKINIQKNSSRGAQLDRKEIVKSTELHNQSDMNSFKNKKKSEGLQYTEKRETRVYEKKCLFPTSGLHQSDKKIRQNNSCQNIHNHSSYLQDNKIIQDVQKIKKINLHSSRHQQVEKSSLERIIGSNEALKLFDTIEKIKKTPNLHVKQLSLRKHSEPINSTAKPNKQKANTARQNTQAFHVDEGSLRLLAGSSQSNIKNDYVQIEMKDMGQNIKNLQHLNLVNASHLEQFRKKSQSPCMIQKTQKNLFILSSEEISRPQPQIITSIKTYPRNGKQKVGEQQQTARNNIEMPNRVASAQQCHQDVSRDHTGQGASAKSTNSKFKRVKNPRINSQLSHNQDRQGGQKNSDRGPSQRKDSEPATSNDKRFGERTQSLKQFIIKQKKQLHKARKQNSSWLDEDDIRAGQDVKVVIKTEGDDEQRQNTDENGEDDYNQRDNAQHSGQQFSQSQRINLKIPLSPSKKSSNKKNSEFKVKSPKKKVKNSSSKKQSPYQDGSSISKRETPSKKVVQIDLFSQVPPKQQSRNHMNESRQIKVSQTSTFMQQRQATDGSYLMNQDLLPIGKDDKLSKSSSVSNMHEDRKNRELLQKTSGHIYIDEQMQHAESQDEDPIEQINRERNRESETEYGASTSQIDMTGRHSDIERQVHQKIRQILKEYRNAINNQEKEKLSLLLKSSADLIQAEVSDIPTEDLRKLHMLSQESLDDTESFFTSMNKIALQQSNKTGETESMSQQQQSSGNKKKKERQTWRKKAVSPEPTSYKPSGTIFKRSSLKERDSAKMGKARADYTDDDQIIDLRNQIQLSEHKRKSVAGNGAFILPNQQKIFELEGSQDQQDEIDMQKDGMSTVEFFLTNSGFGTGAGSNFFFKPSMVDENNRNTLLKSDEFSALSAKSPGSQVGQQQLITLRQQLERESFRAVDTGDEGNLENNNDSYIPQKNLKQIESLKKPAHASRGERTTKKRRKKEREAKQSQKNVADAISSSFQSPKNQQQQQFGYFINPNDGKISLVPISQITPQTLQSSQQNNSAQQQFYTNQMQQNEPSLTQTKQLDLSNIVPQSHIQFGMPTTTTVQPQFYMPSQQQQQVVWMPVPINQMAHYSHNSVAGSAPLGGATLQNSAPPQSQQLYANSAALNSIGQIQTPLNIAGAPPMFTQNGVQVQPFLTGQHAPTQNTSTFSAGGQQAIPQQFMGAPHSPMGAIQQANMFPTSPIDAHQMQQNPQQPHHHQQQQPIPIILNQQQMQQLTAQLQNSQNVSDSSARNLAAAFHYSNSHSDKNC